MLCCCSGEDNARDGTEFRRINVGDPKMEEGRKPQVNADRTPVSGKHPATLHTVHEVGASPGDSSPVAEGRWHDHASAERLTQEQKVQEKARLQAMVRKFCQEAMQGKKCELIGITDGRVDDGTFYIDNQLSRVSVHNNRLNMSYDYTTKEISDIHDESSFTSLPLTSGVRKKLTGEYSQRCTILEIMLKDCSSRYVCIAHKTPQEAATCCTSMKILLWASTNGQKSR